MDPTTPKDLTRYMKRTGKKIYSDVDVLTATFNCFEILFQEFDNICFTISGGKDSGATVQIGNMVAARLHKTFSVIYVDLEAMYQETERFVQLIRTLTQPNCEHFYWVCLPLCEDNATSALNPEFITWDESLKEKWVRPIPPDAITSENNPFPFYENLMDFMKFLLEFAKWSHTEHHATCTGIVIGI